MEIKHQKRKIDGRIKYEKVCSYCGKEVSYFHGNKPSTCPHCGASNYIRPPTETKLFLLQEKYLENRDSTYLSQMFELIKRYAASMIKKSLPKNFTYHYGKVDEKAEDAATLFIENYLISDSFRIDQSFGGYLQWKIKEVLWNKKLQREENHSSIHQTIHRGKSDKEFIDVSSENTGVLPLYGTIEDHTQSKDVDNYDVVDGVCTTIERMMDEIRVLYSYSHLLLVLIGICLRIEGRSAGYMSNYYSHFGSDLQEHVDVAMLLIYRFLKEEN